MATSKMVSLQVQISESALEAIRKQLKETIVPEFGEDGVGAYCVHNACKKVFTGPESDAEECVHHPGTAVFHEGMKFWSCCERKTTDFGTFLDQSGCSRGKHCWRRKESVSNVREDWFQRGGRVHITIYCKGALPDATLVQSDGLSLEVSIQHGFGNAQTVKSYELFGEILPAESVVEISERKVEIMLKQVAKSPWPKLCQPKSELVQQINQQQIRPEEEDEVIMWSGLNEPAERNPTKPLVLLRVQISESALEAIQTQLKAAIGKENGAEFGEGLGVGAHCIHNACKKMFTGPESDAEECVHHPGTAVFHEGMKFWSCCERKTTDFGTFLDQSGCSRGKHCWRRKESVSNVREDWFQRGGRVHITIYCKGALPDATLVQSDGLSLEVSIQHGFGNAQTVKSYELFGEILPAESVVEISERKVEIMLKQRLTSSQERSISASPDAEDFSNGASSPSPLGFGHEELASAAALDLSYSAMEHFLPEFLFSVEFASDPSAWEAQLEKSWTRLEELLEITARRFGRDSLDKVCELLSTICHLLVMEVNSQSEPSIGPILDQFFNEEILLQVQRWALKVPLNARPKCQMMMIRLYEYMVTSSQCPQSLLVHKPILMPLLQLLQWCRRSSADEQRHRCTADTTTAAHHQQRRAMATGVDRCFVRLINQICRKIAEDDTLLHFFFHSSVLTPRGSDEVHDDNEADKNGTDRHHLLIGNGRRSAVDGHQPSTEDGNKLNDGEEDNEQLEDHDRPNAEEKPFLVFDLLVPYLYAPEDVGQLARDALLLIMSVSKQHQFVADYVAQKSNFCPVLAAGLSGCFSQLPHCIFTELGVVDIDEFHKLSVLDAKTLPEISEFHNALLFCNAVAIVAHVSIVRQIVRFFYDGFLLEVFKSSVLESDAQELCSRIVYLHLCLDTVRAPSLVRALVKLLVVAETDRPDGWNLLEVLLSKMNTSDRLCRLTLSLLRTLLSMHCEDLLWCAVFRHLMPYIPLKKSRRPNQSRRFDVNVSLDAAASFLKSVPECTRRVAELYSEEQFEAYMREASDAIRDCALCCAGWRFKYDGISPNMALLNMNNPSDELLSARQPFVRLCSARSSFASTGWNRYFQNRSAHGTLSAEGGGAAAAEAIQSLNELGKDDDDDSAQQEELVNNNRLMCGGGGTSSSQEEDFGDFNPHYDMPEGGARLDYFQFAYEGVSESDEPDSASCSRRDSQESGEEEGNGKGPASRKTMTDGNGRGNGKHGARNNNPPTSGAILPSLSSSPTLSARSRMMDAIVATDWSAMNRNRDQFIDMLDALPMLSDHVDGCDSVGGEQAAAVVPNCWSPVPKKARTVEENIALIESRWQYLEELRKERAETDKKSGDNDGGDNPFRLDLSDATAVDEAESGQSEQQQPNTSETTAEVRGMDDVNSNENGFPMECVEGMGAGILLESMFEALSRLTEHTFATNLQLIGAFSALLAYAQPLLTTYLLYVDALKSRALCRITNLIADLKEQIDAFARTGSSSASPSIGDAAADFEQMVRRAVRHRQTRAERSERLLLHYHHQQQSGGGALATAAAVATTSAWSAARSQQQPTASSSSVGGTFRFTHRAMASAERGHQEEQERTRNFAYAAIAHSQLCLLMAAFALQHSAAIEYPRGAR
uniref:Uncharacterized protein n=1 Tax=Globodera rostochiensis TaxID=31243 RepID=A0A914H209_GLORO